MVNIYRSYKDILNRRSRSIENESIPGLLEPDNEWALRFEFKRFSPEAHLKSDASVDLEVLVLALEGGDRRMMADLFGDESEFLSILLILQAVRLS